VAPISALQGDEIPPRCLLPFPNFLTLNPNSPPPPFAHIHNALQLVDSFLLGQWAHLGRDDGDEEATEKTKRDILERAREEWLVDGLVGLGIVVEIVVLGGKGGQGHVIRYL
jgi:hypothetical protein